ncbi:MAG TPA: SURF1 family protein [Xanthobacteraceae bacterium]|nr:SURF1 family protein [Xanthobacteraceae bacterium]
MRAPSDVDAGGTRGPRRRSFVGLLVPATLAFCVLIGLGVWQLKRKAWKEGLIATLTAQLAAPPVALPPPQNWQHLDQARDQYRRFDFTATFEPDRDALVYASAAAFRPDVDGPGYWVFTPARLGDGGVVMVNRGFVPEGRQDPKSRPGGQLSGPVDIVGAMRWPDARHWFTPNDEPSHNLWFVRDPVAIAAAKGIGPVAPFYIEQESPVPPGGLPQPGKLVVSLPDNHLQYALTWFGLAAVLVGVTASFGLSSRRRTATGPESAQET